MGARRCGSAQSSMTTAVGPRLASPATRCPWRWRRFSTIGLDENGLPITLAGPGLARFAASLRGELVQHLARYRAHPIAKCSLWRSISSPAASMISANASAPANSKPISDRATNLYKLLRSL